MSRIIFDPAAEAEMIDAASFYEGEQAGSGARFLECVRVACEIILEYPEIGERRFGARCKRVLRYEYYVCYRPIPNGIYIVAIAHQKRRPGFWSRRRLR